MLTTTSPSFLQPVAFAGLFTEDKPVIFNFHGFPKDVASLLFNRSAHVGRSRFEILGYIEEGTTTTPWSMLRLNKASRYDIASSAIAYIAKQQPNSKIATQVQLFQGRWAHALREHEKVRRLARRLFCSDSRTDSHSFFDVHSTRSRRDRTPSGALPSPRSPSERDGVLFHPSSNL